MHNVGRLIINKPKVHQDSYFEMPRLLTGFQKDEEDKMKEDSGTLTTIYNIL